MNSVPHRSQAGESQSTGVDLSSVYAAFEAKVENSISIIAEHCNSRAQYTSLFRDTSMLGVTISVVSTVLVVSALLPM